MQILLIFRRCETARHAGFCQCREIIQLIKIDVYGCIGQLLTFQVCNQGTGRKP